MIRNNVVYANASVGIHLTGFTTPSRPRSSTTRSTSRRGTRSASRTTTTTPTSATTSFGPKAATTSPSTPAASRASRATTTTSIPRRRANWASGRAATFGRLVDWSYELGLDAHSFSADPQFVNPAGPDGILGYGVAGDGGLDDNFHVPASSPAVDRGNPAEYNFQEPPPNGDRIDLGAYGNTPGAAPSPGQLVQVPSPSGLEKLQDGQQVEITWRTAGLTLQRPVALIDAGSNTAVDNWGSDSLQILSGQLGFTPTPITQAIDTSGVAHPCR